MKAERRNVVPLFVSLPACFCLHATHILYPARPASVHTDTPHQPHSAPITHVSHINIKHTAQSVQHPVFRPPRHHPIFAYLCKTAFIAAYPFIVNLARTAYLQQQAQSAANTRVLRTIT